MRVSGVSFKGMYNERIQADFLPKRLSSELENARPYLREIARDLPGSNDLFVSVNDEKAAPVVKVATFDNKSKKMTLLTEKNEHNVMGHGLWLVCDTFVGLQKRKPNLFEKIAKEFVTHMDRIHYDSHPFRFDFDKSGGYDNAC